MFKLGSLFDGSGTCPLAARMLGIEPVWASEIEPYPVAVTTKNFPDMKHLGDITKIDGAKIEPVDIITFGSPCQNLSVAGNGKGLAGEQSRLFFEAIRVIKEMKEATDGKYPRICLWENVPGARSSNGGEDFREVLRQLCKICDTDADVPKPAKWERDGVILGDGWSVAWTELDAADWVPQRRKRVYAVLDTTGGRADEILFKPTRRNGHHDTGRKAGKSPTGDAEGGLGGSRADRLSYWIDSFDQRLEEEMTGTIRAGHDLDKMGGGSFNV